jgi:hypothetical protein
VTGLSVKVLEDVLSCWYHLLNLSVTALLSRELTEEECHILEICVSEAVLPLVKLHIETAKKVANSLAREGKLPKKWNEETRKEQQRLKEIKNKVTTTPTLPSIRRRKLWHKHTKIKELYFFEITLCVEILGC